MAKTRKTRTRTPPETTRRAPPQGRGKDCTRDLRALAKDVHALADQLEILSDVVTSQPRMLDIVRGVLRALGMLVERGLLTLNCMRLQGMLEQIDQELSNPNISPERRKELNEMGELAWELHTRVC